MARKVTIVNNTEKAMEYLLNHHSSKDVYIIPNKNYSNVFIENEYYTTRLKKPKEDKYKKQIGAYNQNVDKVKRELSLLNRKLSPLIDEIQKLNYENLKLKKLIKKYIKQHLGAPKDFYSGTFVELANHFGFTYKKIKYTREGNYYVIFKEMTLKLKKDKKGKEYLDIRLRTDNIDKELLKLSKKLQKIKKED